MYTPLTTTYYSVSYALRWNWSSNYADFLRSRQCFPQKSIDSSAPIFIVVVPSSSDANSTILLVLQRPRTTIGFSLSYIDRINAPK
ncbi:hypothetical protein LINGRAHAP2_LOCUS23218 [Linum grandiflorum]